MDPKEIQAKIDRQYCTILLGLINSKSTNREDTHKSATALLTLEPISSFDDAKTKLEFFVSKFPQYKDLLSYLLALEADQKVKHVVDKMHEHLRDNNIDEALKVASNI